MTKPDSNLAEEKPWIEKGTLLVGYIFISTFLAWLVAVLAGQKVLLPALTALMIFPVFGHRLIRGRLGAAAGWVMFWALCMTVIGIAFTMLWPRIFAGLWAGRVDQSVAQGGEYTKNMFVWIGTGLGMESDPSRFIPVHLRHLGLFTLTSAVSGGALGLAFGAVQMNYMNFYVGELAVYSYQPLLAILLGWPPYAIIRVIGYILLATGVSAPLACAVTKRTIPWRSAVRFFIVGLALTGVDILLKWLVAPLWRDILSGIMPTLAGGSGG